MMMARYSRERAHVYNFPGLPGCIGMAERLLQVNVPIPARVQPGGYVP